MKLSELVQKLMKDFLIIFALIIIVITFLRQIYYPGKAFNLYSIYIIMGFSVVSAIIGFILYSSDELSEKNMRIRRIIHFFTLEIVLVVLCSVFDMVKSAGDIIILTLQIAVIYILVRVLSWQKDKEEAKKINEKLKALKKDL